MNFFSSSYSDPFPQESDFSWPCDYFLESCSSSSAEVSDSKSITIIGSCKHKEEEVLLASNNPKRKAGRIKFRETRHPVYRGIRKRNGGKWVSEVREPKKKSRIWLGTFPTAEMAARAHDVAAIALKGKSACLNFADSAWRLPVPASANAKDIQRAASEAAEAFRPSSSSSESTEEERPSSIPVVTRPDDGGGATTLWSENGFFMDDDALFDMPRLMSDMAEALMIPPPPPPPPPQCLLEGSYGDIDMSDSLWNYFLD